MARATSTGDSLIVVTLATEGIGALAEVAKAGTLVARLQSIVCLRVEKTRWLIGL